MSKLSLILALLLGGSTVFSTVEAKDITVPPPGYVAISFDDGPSQQTPKILAILKKYHVHAVFFISGTEVDKYPGSLKQVYDEGNVVGSHGNKHVELTNLKPAEVLENLRTSKEIIKKVIGKDPVCFKPPFDASNDVVTKSAKDLNLVWVGAGFNTFDYERPDADKMLHSILHYVKSGFVISFHDGPEETVRILPALIEGIQKKGLKIGVMCREQDKVEPIASDPAIESNPGDGVFECYAKNALSKKEYEGTSFISKHKARDYAFDDCKASEKDPKACEALSYDRCKYTDKRDMNTG